MGEVLATIADVRGDYPGRLTLRVTEEDGDSQLGAIYALRSRHYSDEDTAAPVYAAQDLTALDTAADATVGGEAVVRHQDLSTGWTPVLSTDFGVEPLMHTGTNRVWAICHTSSATPPRVRLVWDVADMILPEDNASVLIPGVNGFYFVDLGEVRLDPPPVGDHRWRGQIQAKGPVGGEDISIKRLYVLNTDEAYGVLRASILAAGMPLAGYVGRDEFNQSVGDLDNKQMPVPSGVAGLWDTSGSTGDLQVSGSGSVTRTTSSDSGPRYAVAGTTVAAAVEATLDMEQSVGALADVQQVLAVRWQDTGNHLRVVVDADGTVTVEKLVASVPTTLAIGSFDLAGASQVSRTVRLRVDAGGRFLLWLATAGAARLGDPILSGQDDDLATGGDLDEGRIVFWDYNGGAGAAGRTYRNLGFWEPEGDAILHPNRQLEIRWDGCYRQTADGEAWGPCPPPRGDLPRIPPSGLEGRPCEVFIVTSGGDLDQLPDS